MYSAVSAVSACPEAFVGPEAKTKPAISPVDRRHILHD
jgi:hypothetical protein